MEVKKFDLSHIYYVVATAEREAEAAAMLVDFDIIENDEVADGIDPIGVAAAILRERYVYAAFRDEVYNRRAQPWISMRAMDGLETHAMPLDDNDKPTAIVPSKLFARDGRAARVYNERYAPGCDDEIVQHGSVSWLNTWRRRSRTH
ncbi:MAG: hypothetical protein Q4G22_15170 [Paracoccus sp. (in: a-proteobacteria)]|uniref:hypothetical protein n=1 Tax=Paracoccus sp. TaxID=267 RepID=UPI0026E0D2D3|nr:hypothetical protein [Paracoccus sp. (in: a-proteobacteria)]MDO5633154.1 hypothetical protein [Paracoccus sp. (in: a-proteobacteria)]